MSTCALFAFFDKADKSRFRHEIILFAEFHVSFLFNPNHCLNSLDSFLQYILAVLITSGGKILACFLFLVHWVLTFV